MQPWQEGGAAAGPQIDDLVALVDTGAGHSCISPRLAERLGVPPSCEIEQHAAGKESINSPMFHYKLSFPEFFLVEADFAILSHLKEPTDVVIGCDLLHISRLLIDFTTGQWEMHFKGVTVTAC
jgi:predicted aspartyl protease